MPEAGRLARAKHYLRLSLDFGSNTWAQELGRIEIDSPSEEPRQLVLNVKERKTRRVPFLELDEDIYIAVGPERTVQDGAE
jgi:hypothetical protein